MPITPNPNPLYSVNNNGALVYGDRIRTSVNYDLESQLIRGTMSFSKDKLQELDPSYTGYTHIFVLRMPAFMTAVANGQVLDNYEPDAVLKAQQHCKNLKCLIEMGSTSYSGTPDLTLNTAEVNVGWSERSYPAPTSAQYDGKQFTINCLETRGEPLRRAVEYYINGMTDANVKATMLNGALNPDGTIMEPTLANMTFTILVCQVDQSHLRLQDVSLWQSAMITSIERSNLDWTNGEIDIIQAKSLAFSGTYLPDCGNEHLEALAMKLIGTRMKYYKRFRDMSEQDYGMQHFNTNGAY